MTIMECLRPTRLNKSIILNAIDENLMKIADVAWRTLQNSSTDGYIDPYYEQLQYIGDSRIGL